MGFETLSVRKNMGCYPASGRVQVGFAAFLTPSSSFPKEGIARPYA